MSDEAGDDGDEILVLETAEADAGERFDRWLATQCPELSRTRLKQLILQGAVMLNGKLCDDPSLPLKSGMTVTLAIPPPLDDTPLAENIPLDIVYEDDDLIVLNKPAGLVVHPAVGHRTGTLVNALLYHCGDSLSGIGGVRRPGIVHRLDKDTSGLMLVAKSDRAHAGLSAQLADRSLSRRYLALVWGVPSPRKGTIHAAIGRHPSQRLKMAAKVRQARDATTHFIVLENFSIAAALIECQLETGRTHQIRVHMHHAGHPVLGDPLYGIQANAAQSLLKRADYEPDAIATILNFPRQALHAWHLSFIHPVTEEELEFERAAPADFLALQEILKDSSLRA